MTFINVCIFIHFHSKKLWREVIVLKLIEKEWWHDNFILEKTLDWIDLSYAQIQTQ